MKCLWVSIGVAAAAYGSGEHAAAADGAAMPEHVVYQQSGCAQPAFDEVSLARRLRVELADSGARSVEVVAAGVTTELARSHSAVVSILGACADGEQTIVIEDHAGARMLRAVDLRAMAPALRERALAIAIAELFRAYRAALAARQRQPDRATGLMRSKQAPVRSKEPDPPLQAALRTTEPDRPSGARRAARRVAPVLVSAGVEWRFFLEQDTTLAGGRLAVSVPTGSDWLVRFSAEAGAFYDSQKNADGAVDLQLVTGGLGVNAGYRWESVEIGAGPRLELGWGSARVTPLSPFVVAQGRDHMIVIASAGTAGRVRLTPRFWLSLDFEIGRVLRSLDAPALTRSSLAIRGVAAGGRLGIALGL